MCSPVTLLANYDATRVCFTENLTVGIPHTTDDTSIGEEEAVGDEEEPADVVLERQAEREQGASVVGPAQKAEDVPGYAHRHRGAPQLFGVGQAEAAGGVAERLLALLGPPAERAKPPLVVTELPFGTDSSAYTPHIATKTAPARRVRRAPGL